MNLQTTRIPDRLFWWGLLFCTLYSTFRYPMKWGSSSTSPTYSNTPTAVQAAKFIIVLALCLLVCLWTLTRPMRRKHAAVVVSLMFLQFFVLVKALYDFNIAYIDLTFWPLAAMAMVLGVRKISLRSLDRFMLFLLIYSFATDAIEIILFVATGRLPAQGYPNSLIVRFGGWLDAPNDFACIVFLLMGWSFYRFRGLKRIAIETSLFICLILTQSLTAYAFLVVLIMFAVAVRFIKRPFRNLWIPALLLLSLPILLKIPVSEIVNTVMLYKSGSIRGHLHSPFETIGGEGFWMLIGYPKFRFYEDWWVSALINFGIIWLVACLVTLSVLLFSVAKKFVRSTESTEKAILCGVLIFGVYSVLGSANLPFLTYFPGNFLFFVFCLLIFLGKLEGANTGAAVPRLAEL